MNHVETKLAECSYFVRVIFILLYVKQKMKSDLIFWNIGEERVLTKNSNSVFLTVGNN